MVRGEKPQQVDSNLDLEAPPPYSEVTGGVRRDVREKRTAQPPQASQAESSHSASQSRHLDIEPSIAPADAQRARAPLGVYQNRTPIVGAYVVLGSPESRPKPRDAVEEPTNTAQSILKSIFGTQRQDPADQPHVTLQTSYTNISASVWAEDYAWGRPFTVNVATSHGAIEFAVHTANPLQPVIVKSTTSHAANKVLLPRTFHGTLIVSTNEGRTVLSPSLQARSVRIPCGPEEPLKRSAAWYEIGGPGGVGRAEVRTCYADVEVYLWGDKKPTKKQDDQCAVM